MGRTIYFAIKGEVSEAGKEKAYKISQDLNSGNFKDVWTCENFFVDFYSYYPNWSFWGKDKNTNEVWEIIDKHYQSLRGQGLTHKTSILEMVEKNYINLAKDKEDFSSFVKVGGNEYNAFLVLFGILEISKKINNEITVSDEGEYLFTPIIIKDGKAKIDLEELNEDWNRWKEQGYLDPKNPEYNKYGKADKVKTQKAKIKKYPDYTNIGNLTRKVNPEEFLNYAKYNAGQIMAGFHGEYWNLTDEDPEKASFEMLGKITGMIKKAGWKNIEIAGGEKTKC